MLTNNTTSRQYKLAMVSTVGGTATTTNYVNGYVYNTSGGTSTLNFMSSPEGRAVKNTGGNYEYQYAIADHQGNTRILFTSAAATPQTTLADFDGDSNDQESQFTNVPPPIPYGAANNTPGGSRVIRMNQSNPVGPGISKKVFPGDKVDMEVYSYYESTSGYGTNLSNLASLVATAFVNSTGGVDLGGAKTSGVNSAFTGFGTGTNQGDGAPAAYLNYILFDQNYKVMDAGWQVVPAASFTKEYVNLPTVTVKEPGYIFVYLSYEDQSNNYVYFDDFKVTVTPTNILQNNEYYPFGLQTANSWTRDNSSNNFLYNEGSELNSTTGMYDLPFRNYDAALGRFFQVDPLAHRDSDFTPYHYAGNNPIGANDPTGLLKFIPGEVGRWEPGILGNYNDGWTGWSTDFGASGGPGGGGTGFGSDGSGFSRDSHGNSYYTSAMSGDVYISWGKTGDNLVEFVRAQDVVDYEPGKDASQNANYRQRALDALNAAFANSFGQSSGNSTGDPDTFLGLWWYNFKAMWSSGSDHVVTKKEIDADRAKHPEFYKNMERIGMAIPFLTPGTGILGLFGEGAAGTAATEYTLTATVASKLASRPFLNSPLLVEEIMATGPGAADAFFEGGMNWVVEGTFNGSKGVYQLGVNPETKVIYHFLFKTAH